MNISEMAQVGSAVSNLIFVIIITIGYIMMIRLYRQMVKIYDRMTHLMEEQSISMGRPLVIVYEDPDALPEVNLIIQNVGFGPAKDISFEFSDPIESSDGFVLSDLNIFREGTTSLAPGTKIVCYWDNLENLLPKFKLEDGVAEHIEVTTRYKDLTEASYETKWDIHPSAYKGIRNLDRKNMTDLVEAVEEISETRNSKSQSSEVAE